MRKLIALIGSENQRDWASLAALLESAGYRVQGFATGQALLAAPLAPADCIVIHVAAQESDALALLKLLVRRDAAPPVVLLSGSCDVGLAVEAMKLGAADFLETSCRPSVLRAAIERACAEWEDRRRLREAARRAEARLSRLPSRLRQVLLGILKGKPNKVIAFELGLSTRTVEAYRAQLLAKLGVRSTAEAIRVALDGGIDLAEGGDSASSPRMFHRAYPAPALRDVA